MTTSTHTSVVRRIFVEGFNQNRPEVFDELLGPDYVNHDLPTPAAGPEGFKQVIAAYLTAFPDMQVVVEDVLAEGDRVVTRGRLTGTHRGEFMGIPATGRQVSIPYIDIWRLEGGRAVDNWVQLDRLGMLQQLGGVPAPAASGD
jgi:steroid delta-isomerase-like uncharacterized protein